MRLQFGLPSADGTPHLERRYLALGYQMFRLPGGQADVAADRGQTVQQVYIRSWLHRLHAALRSLVSNSASLAKPFAVTMT